MIIRKIEQADNKTLAKIIREVFEEHDAPRKGTVYSDPTTDDLYALFLAPGSVLWVAELENELVGCCGVYPTGGLEKGCVELVKFYLSAKARGKGIGKALMKKCIKSAKGLGYKQMYIESLPEFSKAVSMYEQEGFRKLEQPLGDSEHSGCSIWMIKDLL